MKYIFIVNAVAGKGKYKKILPKIEKDEKLFRLNSNKRDEGSRVVR